MIDRILIKERDLTTNSYGYKFSDTVFIPGFAIGGTAAKGIPVRCETIAEFESAFGSEAPTFIDDLFYPIKNISNSGFDSPDIPQVVKIANPNFNEDEDEGPTNLREIDDVESLKLKMYNEGDLDLSYILAKRCIRSGLPVVYVRMNSTDEDGINNINVETAYRELLNIFSSNKLVGSVQEDIVEDGILFDSNLYDIKFITSGGYPTWGHSSNITESMLYLASKRGDCVALIDHTNYADRPVGSTNSLSVYNSVTNSGILSSNASYGAMFTPWVKLNDNLTIPASFIYLEAFAQSCKYNPNWLAVAGVRRGLLSIQGLNTSTPITNTIADSYQQLETGRSINAITYINGYGYCIWGNRTLTNRQGTGVGFATSTLNIRNLVSDVKKLLRSAAISCMFELNNDVLWINFKSLISPLLDRMVAGYGLKSYKIIKNQVSDKSKLSADIRLFPENTIESFDLTVTLSDEDAEVSEA